MLELDDTARTSPDAHPPVDRQAVDELASLEAAVQALHDGTPLEASRPLGTPDASTAPVPTDTAATTGPTAPMAPVAPTEPSTPVADVGDAMTGHRDDHGAGLGDEMIMIGVGGYTAKGGPMTPGASPRRARRPSRRWKVT